MRKKKPKKIFYKNKRSGMMWKVEPYFSYRVTNLTSGVVYDETVPMVEERLKSDNIEILDSPSVEILYGDSNE